MPSPAYFFPSSSFASVFFSSSLLLYSYSHFRYSVYIFIHYIFHSVRTFYCDAMQLITQWLCFMFFPVLSLNLMRFVRFSHRTKRNRSFSYVCFFISFFFCCVSFTSMIFLLHRIAHTKRKIYHRDGELASKCFYFSENRCSPKWNECCFVHNHLGEVGPKRERALCRPNISNCCLLFDVFLVIFFLSISQDLKTDFSHL